MPGIDGREKVDDRWYWVKTANSEWFPALHDSTRAGGWSNADTWEDFNNEVTDFRLIPLPDDRPERTGPKAIDWSKFPLGKAKDAEIARMAHCTPSSVARARKVRGIPAFSNTGPKGIDWDQVPLGQFSDAELGRRLGCSSVAVYHARRRRNIPTNKVNHANP